MLSRATALLLILCLALFIPVQMTAAEGSPVMAGFDEASSGHDWNNNCFFLAMEEKTGQSFQYRQFKDAAEYAQWKAGLAPGADLPAVLFKAALTDAETVRLYENGVLMDMIPLLAEHAPNLWALLQADPAVMQAVTLPDGAIAALPMIDPMPSNNLIWINQRWLTVLNLEMPTTIEALTDVLRAFKTQDPNRNGRADEIPMTFTGLWDLRFLQHAFGLIMNDRYLGTDDSGTCVSLLTDARNRAFLTWLGQLWAEELIDRNGFTSGDTLRKITDTNAAVPYGVVFGPTALQLLPASAADSFVPLEPLAFEGKAVYRSLLGPMTKGTFAITTACADPSAMLEWIDFLYTEEGCYLSRAGQKDIDYEVHEDGTWSWLYSAEDVMNIVMTEDTIADGSATPGYVSPSYQLAFDDDATHRQLERIYALASKSVEPIPQIYLTDEEREKIDAIWPAISEYCETQMTWFITGDQKLEDDTWNAFCQKARELGIDEVAAIYQSALHRAQ